MGGVWLGTVICPWIGINIFSNINVSGWGEVNLKYGEQFGPLLFGFPGLIGTTSFFPENVGSRLDYGANSVKIVEQIKLKSWSWIT